jgi:hypothetical protein
MGNIWDELTNDGPEFLTEFGRTVVFRNQTFKALVSRAPVEQMLTNGGFAYNSSYNVRIYAPEGTTLMLDPPTQGEHITVFGRRYTITNVTNRPPDPWVDVGVTISSNA